MTEPKPYWMMFLPCWALSAVTASTRSPWSTSVLFQVGSVRVVEATYFLTLLKYAAPVVGSLSSLVGQAADMPS